MGWDPATSSASNLGPNDAKLLETVTANRATVAASEGVSPEEVPADAVTSSGSGLDPHISKDYATLQVPRVARANGLEPRDVQELVDKQTSSGLEAFLSQPSVNVTLLNLDVANLAAHRN